MDNGVKHVKPPYKKDYYYELPEQLIAQEPIERRERSRLLILNRNTGEISHKMFYDITQYLKSEDCIVLNDTKVLSVRLNGINKRSGTPVEVLLLEDKGADIWECIVKPGKKARPGDEILVGDNEITIKVMEIVEDGVRVVELSYEGNLEEKIERLGEMPSPPYVKKKLTDKSRYQTVYAKNKGSAAAPTAGFHFTNEILKDVLSKGVKIANVTLHVGLGTFRPVKEENVLDHKMHKEFFVLSEENANIINETKKNGGRIICVGTTSVRTLESCADDLGIVAPKSGYTDIFIYPPYKFKACDCLITNFHIPESTLLMLVSAFAGKENIFRCYNEAIKEKYRFFSFGDAMFIC